MPNIRIREQQSVNLRNQTIKKFVITKKGKNKSFKPSDVRELVNGLQKQYDDDGENAKILVRAESILSGSWTLKSYDGILAYDDEEDYLRGRVRDTTKFTYASTLYIHVKIDH